MKRLVLLAAAGTLFLTPALAQDHADHDAANARPTSNIKNPAVKDPQKNVSSTPVAGANSFTMAQARSAIEARGYTRVSGLAKDDKGVWRGTAARDGRTGPVSVDYQGNVN